MSLSIMSGNNSDRSLPGVLSAEHVSHMRSFGGRTNRALDHVTSTQIASFPALSLATLSWALQTLRPSNSKDMKLSFPPSAFGLDNGLSCVDNDSGGAAFAVLSPYTESLYRSRDFGCGGWEFCADPSASCPRWAESTSSPSPDDDFNTFGSLFSHDITLSCSPLTPSGSAYSPDERDTLSWAYTGMSYPYNASGPSFQEGGISLPCPILASPTSSSSCSDQSSTPSPLQLNEFTNVFDFDFGTVLPHGFSAPTPENPPEPLSSLSKRRRSPYARSLSPQNLSPLDFTPARSREPSPLHDGGHDPKRRHPCQIPGCARRFTSQYTLKVHMEAHKPKPRVSFHCTLGCSEKFSRQHDRLRHEVAKHGKICEFLCDDCGRFFSTSKTLGNHKCPVARGGTRWIHV